MSPAGCGRQDRMPVWTPGAVLVPGIIKALQGGERLKQMLEGESLQLGTERNQV